MSITLRKKTIKNGQMQSLYLDIYEDGIRSKETLKMNIFTNPKTPIEKNYNKETESLANAIRAKRELEIRDGIHGFKSNKNRNCDFLDYFDTLVKHRAKTGVNHDTWLSVYRHLETYIKGLIRRPRFDEVDVIWLENFKNYLLSKVSQNSAHSYFNKIKASLHQAERDKIIGVNPAHRVASPKQKDTKREYLTENELKKLAPIEFKYNEMKRAFFFSVFTGLRWSDIEKLKWSEIRFNDKLQWHIVYTQRKTKDAETLPISEQAKDLLGKAGKSNELIFKDLKYSARHNTDLQNWITKAGIEKHITFHCARHTYATLLISNGTDMLSVSKMLGHRNLKTTEIYAKVIDKLKVEAANNIPKINFNFND